MDTSDDKTSTVTWWNCLLIPKLDDASMSKCMIPNSDNFFLAFFSCDRLDDYAKAFTEPINVRCKVFNSMKWGFTTLCTIHIPRPKQQLYDKNFVLTNKEFKSFERVYNYKFVSYQAVPRGKIVWNKTLVLSMSELVGKLMTIYFKCSVNWATWFVLMTALIRSKESGAFSANMLVYAREFIKSSTSLQVSSSFSQNVLTWPHWFVENTGVKQCLAITSEFHFFHTKLHERASDIYTRFNAATVLATKGLAPNMLFFEMIAKHFRQSYDIINSTEKDICTILREFTRQVNYYETKFLEELQSYTKKTIDIKRGVRSELLQSYVYDDTTTDALPSAMSVAEMREEVKSLYNSNFKRYNLNRSMNTKIPFIRTALYMDRWDLLTGKVPKLEKVPFPLRVPFVYTTPTMHTYIKNPTPIDRPFIQDKELHTMIHEFLKDKTGKKFVAYSTRMFNIIVRHNYTLNEQIVVKYPIYAMSFDVDITDKLYAIKYSKGGVNAKLEMRQRLINLFIKTFVVLGITDIDESNAYFMMYESQLQKGEPVDKVGIRFIVRTKYYVLGDSEVMFNITKIMNFLMNLDGSFPGACVDEGVWSSPGKFLRLPLNCKRNTRGKLHRPLIPIMTNMSLCFVPSAGLIHHKHGKLAEHVNVIYSTPNPNSCSIVEQVKPQAITLRMLTNKLSPLSNQRITTNMTKVLLEKVCPSVGKVVKEQTGVELVFQDHHIEMNGYTGIYTLAKGLSGVVCMKKRHLNPNRNPCSIKCFINKSKTDGYYGKCYIYCFGSDCGSIFLCAVDGL